MIPSFQFALMSIPFQNYWGPVTSTLDWCEVNNQFSPLVVEMANSFSNILTIALGLYGALRAKSQDLPLRYITCFTGVAIVGLGSFIFHATLLYEAQLADELPMILVASHGFFVLLDTRPGFSLKNARGLVPLILFNILFGWSYTVYRNPVYHQIAFASIMLVSIYRTNYLIGLLQPSKGIDQCVKSTIVKLYWAGTSTFLLGFLIWNLDNVFCQNLTTWKVAIGWPFAFLLEGHSWWHIFTALGSYLMMLGNTYFAHMPCSKNIVLEGYTQKLYHYISFMFSPNYKNWENKVTKTV